MIPIDPTSGYKLPYAPFRSLNFAIAQMTPWSHCLPCYIVCSL